MFSPRITFLFKTVLLFICIAVVVFIYEQTTNRVQSYTYYQIFGCMIVMLLLVWPNKVSFYVSQWPTVYKRILFPTLFLLISSNYLKLDRITFPFVSWGMYTHTIKKSAITYFSYEGVDVHGDRFRIDPSKILTSLDGQIRQGLNSTMGDLKQIRDRKGLQNEETETKIQRMQLLLGVIGRRYNEDNEEAPIQYIDIIEHTMNIQSYPDPNDQRNIVLTVHIQEDGHD